MVIRAGDRLGLFCEGACPILSKFDYNPTLPVYHHPVKNVSEVFVGSQVEFDTVPMPYMFSLIMYYDTGMEHICFLQHANLAPHYNYLL